MAYGYYSDPGTSFGNTGGTTGETFIQRQKRLQASQAPQTQQQSANTFTPVAGSRPGQSSATAAPTGSVGTPVTGNGTIPPPTPAAPAPQQAAPQSSTPAPAAPVAAPAPAPAAAPVRTNFRWGNGVNTSNGYDPNAQNGNTNSWTEDDWKRYETVMGIKPAAAAAAAPAATGPVAAAGSALGGAAEAAKSGMFTQAAPPEHDFQNWQQLELVSKLLANPETLSPEVIEQMKQRSMEEGLSANAQAQQQADEEAAASGFALNGGRAVAQRRASNESLTNAILGQNRDIEIKAAEQNRQDQLNAAQLSEAILGGQVSRGSQVYGDILAGQSANRGDYWTGKAQDLQRYGIDQGVAVDTSRIASGDRQFNARLGEDARQSNNQMGFNWAQLGQNGQNALIQAIMGTLK